MKIIVQNLAIEYQDQGSGPVLLFLHGWQDSLRTFDALAVDLSKKYRVVRLDLPGFGGSETPKDTWELENYAQLVEEFIQKTKLQVYAVVGHSLGGRIILKAQSSKRLSSSKTVLIASAGFVKSKNLRNSVLKIIAKIGGLITYIPPLIFWRDKLRRRLYNVAGSDYLNTGVLKETFLKIIAEDLTTNAQKITNPTLLIWGSEDEQTPLADGQKFAKLISNSKLEVIDGVGHFVHQQQAQKVIKLIREFL